MSPIKLFVRCACLCLLFLSCGVEVARAQAAGQPCGKVNEIKDFVQISDMRDNLQTSIAELEDEIDTLTEQLPKGGIAAAQQELENLEQGLKAIRPRPATDGKDEPAGTSDVVQKRIDTLNTQIDNFETNNAKLEEQKKLLAESKIELECLQQRIRSLLTPEQDFKLTMSKYFAGLVGLVILGFFVMAFLDETVRRAIFSGATGIQFLTLFSIVIAIILFGITGILGDKELAALLGGLSGFILGRYNSPDAKKSSDDPDEPANPPPANPPPNP